MTRTSRLALALTIAAMGGPAAARSAELGVTMTGQTRFVLVGSVHLCNTGKAPAENIEATAFLPRNLVGQIVYRLDFLPRPTALRKDAWDQQIATWRVERLEPGEHRFFLWIARAASFDVKFDIESLRKGDLLIPRHIRAKYLWSGEVDAILAGSYFDRCQELAAYVRRTASQELSGLPFDTALAHAAHPGAEAALLTRLAYANDIPCRTIGAYVRAVGSDFSIDQRGAAWNEIYFPQSGWVPLAVSDPRRFGHKGNNAVVVKTAGYDPDDNSGLWGAVSGAGRCVTVRRRGYSAAMRDPQEKDDMVKLFESLLKETDPEKIARILLIEGQSGDSMAIPLIEPYLYHREPVVVESAAAAIGATRQGLGALLLIDALGSLPQADAALIKHAESLTGVNFGSDTTAWRTWIHTNLQMPPG